MSSAVSSFWHNLNLRDILGCVQRDRTLLILGAVLLGLAGGWFGKYTNVATSSAQLVLTPIPLQRAKVTDDALAVMLAAPLDVTSMSLLCKSDEVLQETMDKLNEAYQRDELSAPFNYLTKLKTKLDFQVTVAKETPYELTYAPILELSAKAKNPHDAQVMVNTWAEVVSNEAKKFQDTVQMPAAKALDERVAELKTELTDIEMQCEKFQTENNMMYYEARLENVIGQVISSMKTKNELEAEMEGERASLEAYQKALTEEKPVVELRVTPSQELVAVLADKMGLPAPKDAAAPAPSDASAPETAEQAPSIMSMDNINEVYWDLRGKCAASQAGLAKREAQVKELENLIKELEVERTEIQAKLAQVSTEKLRLGRQMGRIENAYTNVAMKREFANVAGKLDHPVLQVISKGSTWPLPRFRRMLTYGAMSGFFGLFAAAACSIVGRMVIKPALES